jgi:hypothetical protein
MSLEELSITSGGPGDDIDEWLKFEDIEPASCGCDDTACLLGFEPQIEQSAAAEDQETGAAKAGSLIQQNGPNGSGNSSSLVQQKSSRTVKSVITLHWVGQVLDYRNCFMRLWTAMPVSPSAEFKIVGTKYDISKDLNKRPDLTTSSPSSYNNQPINLCITKPMGDAAKEYAKAFAGGFAGIGGFATLITGATSIFGAGEAATAIHGLASNPSAFNLDAALDALVENSKVSAIKRGWSRLTGDKTIAWLSLGSCGRAPITIEFKVINHGGRYSASWDDGRALTAKQIAALIVMSR